MTSTETHSDRSRAALAATGRLQYWASALARSPDSGTTVAESLAAAWRVVVALAEAGREVADVSPEFAHRWRRAAPRCTALATAVLDAPSLPPAGQLTRPAQLGTPSGVHGDLSLSALVLGMRLELIAEQAEKPADRAACELASRHAHTLARLVGLRRRWP